MAYTIVINGCQKDMCYDEIGLCAQNISRFNNLPIGRFYIMEGVKLTSPYEFSGEGVLAWIGVGTHDLATPHNENSQFFYPKSKIVANPSRLHNNN
jgi:hypothetical protein